MNRIMISDSLYANWPGTASWRWTGVSAKGSSRSVWNWTHPAG